MSVITLPSGPVSGLAINPCIKGIAVAGGSAAGKNFFLDVARSVFPDLWYLPSVTTRERRRHDKDKEYKFVTPEEFERMRDENQFIWHVQPFGKAWYGTLTVDLDEALTGGRPFLTHLHPSCVFRLHSRSRLKDKINPGILSLLAICNDQDLIEERMRSRGTMSEEELRERLNENLAQTLLWRQSGYYHGLVDSTENPPEEVVRAEVIQYLTSPIPSFRCF